MPNIEVSIAQWTNGSSSHTITDADGRYTVNLAPGDYSLMSRSHDYHLNVCYPARSPCGWPHPDETVTVIAQNSLTMMPGDYYLQFKDFNGRYASLGYPPESPFDYSSIGSKQAIQVIANQTVTCEFCWY